MTIWGSFAGMIKVEVVTADPEKMLRCVNDAGIEMHELRHLGEIRFTFLIERKKLPQLKQICERNGDTLTICKKLGLYWFGQRVIRRPILLFGEVLLLLVSIWLPTRVLFVRVEGNSRIPVKMILSAAEDCGVTFGASRRRVRSENVKNGLLSLVPDLQWAGINTDGCTATISVREKTETVIDAKEEEISSILADRDGFVISCTATAGELMINPGETVRKGQLLISSYRDCGRAIRAERAEGEVFAQTKRYQESILPSKKMTKGSVHQVKRKYSIRIRKKRIFLWKDSGIWDSSCGRMYKEYYITLPGGFCLPVCLCVESYSVYELMPTEVSYDDAERSLMGFTEDYLLRQMVAGRIIHSVQTMTAEEERYRYAGEYACIEMIGNTRKVQIGDTNGKIS